MRHHVTLSRRSGVLGVSCGKEISLAGWRSLLDHPNPHGLKSKILNDFPRFFGILVRKLTVGDAISLALKMKRDMIIEILDLEPNIDAMMRDFMEHGYAVSSLMDTTTSSNLRNQATIQDGRATLQNVQGRQTQSYMGNFIKGKATGTWVIMNTRNVTANQSMVIRCYNYKDKDCDEAPTTSAVFMACLTSYDSNVLSEYSEQPVFVNDSNIEITSDNNVISYDQYMKENESEVVKGTTSSEQQNAMIMSVIDEMSNQLAKCNAVN
ncbi:hypothetical protein Tco_0873176 [Tanacetum coccineum]